MPAPSTIDATKKTARTQERRRKTRSLISTPVRVRSLAAGALNFDETTTTINLSSTGILIETANPAYHHAMKVSVILAYGSSVGTPQSEQEGRVVRVNELRDGRRAVAIALTLAHGEEKGSSADATPELKLAGQQTPESTAPLVLVLESETTASEFMKTYLVAEGYEVITVPTMAEARYVLDRRTPSLLIAEIEGEGMPGYSLCSHCKETPRLKPVPILLMTSSAYPSDYAKAHSLGAIVCMAKPFKRERLGHVVRLLAPPPNANQAMPVRAPDLSRRSGAAHSKASPKLKGRRFRLPPMFGT